MNSPSCRIAAEWFSVVQDIVLFCHVSVSRQRPCEAVNNTIPPTGYFRYVIYLSPGEWRNRFLGNRATSVCGDVTSTDLAAIRSRAS